MSISRAQEEVRELLAGMEHPRLASCLALNEEAGEVADEVMKLEIYEETTDTQALAAEMADLLVALCELANVYGIDLEKAFAAKLEELRPRVRQWRLTLVEILGRKRDKLD